MFISLFLLVKIIHSYPGRNSHILIWSQRLQALSHITTLLKWKNEDVFIYLFVKIHFSD